MLRETHLVGDPGSTEDDAFKGPRTRIEDGLGSIVLGVETRVVAGVV